MTRRLGRILIRIGIVVVALLLVAEVALRTIGFGNPVRYAEDPYCGFIVLPNQHSRRFFAQNDINSFGMRSPEISVHKDPGTFRVMILGDSVTYGTTYVDQKRIFTSILQQRLTAKMNRNVEVLNCSAGSWAVGNEVGYLTSRGTFEADLVMLVLNTSDPVQGKASLPPNAGYPTEKPTLAVGELVNRYVMPRISDQFATKPDAGSVASTGDTLDTMPEVEAQILEGRKFAYAHGAGFALAFVPFRHEEAKLPVYKQAYVNFVQFCKTQRIPLVDMTQEMNNYPANVTHMDGAHLRPEGHAIVAARLEREWTSLLTAAAPDAGEVDSTELAAAHKLVRE